MNLEKKIIINDTNIITDLANANILREFLKLDNVYVINMVKMDEFNNKTCDDDIRNMIKVVSATSEELTEAIYLSEQFKKLSIQDLLNFVRT